MSESLHAHIERNFDDTFKALAPLADVMAIDERADWWYRLMELRERLHAAVDTEQGESATR